MRFFMLPLVLISTIIQTGDWSPPRNPDPSAILTEARADVRAKEYKTALAKHIWYHENALKIQPSQRGVRLSYAINDWVKLGEKYPPALKKLREIRDESTQRVIADDDKREEIVVDAKTKLLTFRDLFHDIESINEELDENQKTVETFKTLEQNQPEKARMVYGLAQKALVLSKEYEICLLYTSPSPRDRG